MKVQINKNRVEEIQNFQIQIREKIKTLLINLSKIKGYWDMIRTEIQFMRSLKVKINLNKISDFWVMM